MLGRLLKYEMKSTSRIMWFLYAAVAVMGAILGLVIRIEVAIGRMQMQGLHMGSTGSGIRPTDVLLIIMIVVYALLITVMAVLTTIMIVLRFQKSLLEGEGYLMHTLPVPTWMHVVSKLVIAFVWQVIAGFSALLSMLLIGLLSGGIPYIVREVGFDVILEKIGNVLGSDLILFVLGAILSTILTILHFYLSMAIGNLANKNKMLLAVAAFIGTGILFSVISTVLSIPLFSAVDITFTMVLIRAIVMSAVLAAACYAGTVYILKNKLNLA